MLIQSTLRRLPARNGFRRPIASPSPMGHARFRRALLVGGAGGIDCEVVDIIERHSHATHRLALDPTLSPRSRGLALLAGAICRIDGPRMRSCLAEVAPACRPRHARRALTSPRGLEGGADWPFLPPIASRELPYATCRICFYAVSVLAIPYSRSTACGVHAASI